MINLENRLQLLFVKKKKKKKKKLRSYSDILWTIYVGVS